MEQEIEAGSPQPDAVAPITGDDGRTPMAVAAGVSAALIAGGLWALIVNLTGYEIGYAAWGVGVLVGVSMMRVTQNRSKQLAAMAAGLALVGLLVGKALIFLYGTGALADELYGDHGFMRGYVAWSLYDSRDLDEATLEVIDATADGDELSDEVWESMTAQAASVLAGLTDVERKDIARVAAATLMSEIGLVQGIRFQLSAFDILWIIFAVGSAFHFMMPAEKEESLELVAT
jgi:hypothetical protein